MDGAIRDAVEGWGQINGFSFHVCFEETSDKCMKSMPVN